MAKSKSKQKENPLNGLSRSQKLILLDVIKERKRRSRDQLDEYQPNSGQRPVHISDHILRCVFSGNGAGKTALGANEAIWAAKGYNPVTNSYNKVPARIIVLLDHPEKVEDVWLPELRKWTNIPTDRCNKRGKPYYTQITFRNGSEILFMFHQQDPMIFESIECDLVIADEPPPRHVYVSLRRGGRKKNRTAKYLMLGTPITGAWMRQEIYDPWARGDLPDTSCFKFGTMVNEGNLAEDYIKTFSQVLSDK
ncbi:MAG: hypothetical protein KAS32_28330, partial [Candidatus Peribacteraceae bacterium]|nr:hypothetical protein [Candidatus Peribacteraceae bacterium]